MLQEVEEEREEEAKLRKEMMGDEPESGPAQHEFARLNNVRRKPVPGGTTGTGNGDPSLPISQQQENVPPSFSYTSEQRPLPPFPDSVPAAELPNENVHPATGQRVQFLERRPTRSPIPRRPLPPVPDEEPSLGGNPAKRHNRWSAMAGLTNNRGPENWNNRHSMELRPHSAHGSPSPARRRSPGESPTRRSHDSRSPDPSSGFHITLIRRDPTHGTQWNVATISTPRVDDGVIDIEISTPGYNRFIAQDEPLSLGNLGFPTDGASAPSLSALQALQESAVHASNNNIINTSQTGQEPPGPRKFRRKLCVSKPYQDEARGSMDLPRGSIDSIGPGSPTTMKAQGLSKLKSGYYSFSSPWNGICTFATAVNGRSLKCKHMIPMHAPPGSNLQNMASNPAVTAAEIRFNTPFQPNHLHHQPNPAHLSPFLLSQTPTFAAADNLDPPLPSNVSAATATTGAPSLTTTTTNTTTTTTSKRNSLALLLNPNSYTNRPRSHSGNSTYSHNTTTQGCIGGGGLTRKPSTTSTASSDDPDRLDFSLARERAGGGMRGKSAKLGKLVVEDEGIKMLDLVVAACMGVWWRGYYY